MCHSGGVERTTTWRALLPEALQEHGETLDDIEHLEGDLDAEWVQDYGSPNAPTLRVWTANRVYFNYEYDGWDFLESVERNPQKVVVDGRPPDNLKKIEDEEFKVGPNDIALAVNPHERPLNFRLQNPFDDSMDVTAEGRDYDHVVVTLRRKTPDPTDNLCGFELDVLEDEAKGLQRPWGAAIGQALEVLRGRGLVGPGGVTERGRAVLRAKGRL